LIGEYSSVYIPFDATSQFATLTLTGSSVTVEYVDYNTITIGGNNYVTGDTLVLDNQLVTVASEE
jgi:hypothetical protein